MFYCSISKEHGIAILDQPEPFDSIRPIHFYCEAPREVHRGESVGIRCMIMNRSDKFFIQEDVMIEN